MCTDYRIQILWIRIDCDSILNMLEMLFLDWTTKSASNLTQYDEDFKYKKYANSVKSMEKKENPFFLTTKQEQ